MTEEKNTDKKLTKDELKNRFLYNTAIVKRAKQLREGIRPLVEFDSPAELHPIECAIKEIESGKIGVVLRDESRKEEEFMEEMEQIIDAEIESRDNETSLLGKRDKKSKL